METSKENVKRLERVVRHPERVKAISLDQATPSTLELDYHEAAAKLEHIYKRSPATSDCHTEVKVPEVKRGRQSRKAVKEGNKEANKGTTYTVVRSRRRKSKILSLDKRIALRKKKESEVINLSQRKKRTDHDDEEKINRLFREYSASTDFVSLDWKKMKISPVLTSSEHAWLFKLMQPLKAILHVKENLQSDLGREPTDGELVEAANKDVIQLRRDMEVGRAARNKLIKMLGRI